jgi:hypothetical protein
MTDRLLPPTGKPPRVIKHFRKLRPQGEVTTWIWDVVRIFSGTKVHTVVYRGLATLDVAQKSKQYLQDQTNDVCYVVGRKSRRLTRKRGT